MPTYSSFAGSARQNAAGGTQTWSSIANATGTNDGTVAGCIGNLMAPTTGYRLELYNWNFTPTGLLPTGEIVTSVTVTAWCKRTNTVSSTFRWRNVPGGWDEDLITTTWPTTLSSIENTTTISWWWADIVNWNTDLEIWTQPSLGTNATAEVDAVRVVIETELAPPPRRRRTRGNQPIIKLPDFTDLAMLFLSLTGHSSAPVGHYRLRRMVPIFGEPPPPPMPIRLPKGYVAQEHTIPPDWLVW